MLAIARAIAEPRTLILIDEPTKGWRRPSSPTMITAFARAEDGETTMLLVEQNFASPASLGDSVAVMDDGRVAHQGTMAAFAADSALQQHLLGLGMDTHQ
jgi:branched-chain amino acid transport system ATP-binding protein